MFDLLTIARLLLAVALGALIGIEREVSDKPAGFRTIILICLGSALFTLLSLEISAERGDPGRVAAQVVTGIGFLGAGAIIRGQGRVTGLTTAATIWISAAVGMASGAGLWQLACLVAAMTFAVLRLVGFLEMLLDRYGSARTYVIRVGDPQHLAEMREVMKTAGLQISHDKRMRTHEGVVGSWWTVGRRAQQEELVDRLLADPRVIEFTW